MTLAETIHDALAKHMDGGGVVMGQNVGEGLGGTIPTDHRNLLTLPTSDCSNAGIAVGYALAGRRPVFVLRFQGLAKVGLWPVLEYAGKSKALWGVPCPVFVRAVAREGLLGPVCSGAQHGLAMRCPGVRVVAPMTPEEWSICWQQFLDGDEPMYCSEQYGSWSLQVAPDRVDHDQAYENIVLLSANVTVVAVGAARLFVGKARWACTLTHFGLVGLKPLVFPERCLESVADDGKALVVDCEPQTCGAAEHVAMELHRLTGAKVRTLALDDRVAGFSPESDVLTPSVERIVEAVKELERD